MIMRMLRFLLLRPLPLANFFDHHHCGVVVYTSSPDWSFASSCEPGVAVAGTELKLCRAIFGSPERCKIGGTW